MSKKIKTISFLVGNQRVFLHATKQGKFSVPVLRRTSSGHKTINKAMYPREVVENGNVKVGDPTLTLESGEKIRVYQGGDSSYMLVHAESMLDLHETLLRQESTELPPVKEKSRSFSTDYSIFEDLGDWY